MTSVPHNTVGSVTIPARCRRVSASAFTLIEMLLVLVLIAALCSILVANLAGRQDAYALRVATDDLAAALRYAAEQARLRGRCHRLALLEQASAFRVEAAGLPEADEFAPVAGLAGKRRNLPGGVQILGVLTETGQMRELPKSLDFEAGGGGFCGTIRLGNRQGHTMAVEVIPGSALVVVREEGP